MRFDVHSVAVSGRPWPALVAVEWTAYAVPVVVPEYENCGAHLLRIDRGRVTHLLAYEASAAVATACDLMARHGLSR